MTPLQQTALEFCRECLGWEDDVRLSGDLVRSGQGRDLCYLRYTDLSAVLEAVRGWCDEHGHGIEMLYEQGQWWAFMDVIKRNREMANCGKASDPCHALLSACLEAHRKLKGISHE